MIGHLQLVTLLLVLHLVICWQVVCAASNQVSKGGDGLRISKLKLMESTARRPIGKMQTANEIALRNGLYGAVAGSVQVISLMWLRTIVNYQYRYGVSTLEAIHHLYKEGGIARFYRGMPFALLQNPLMKFGAVAANEGSKVLVSQCLGGTDPSPALTSSLGTIFSILWKLFLVPIETVKTVLQVDGSAGLARLMEEIYAGNIQRLYRGSWETILSTTFSHYPWFYVHNLLDQRLQRSADSRLLIVRSAFIGFVASAVSDCISNALRVLKTLRQTIGDDNAAFQTILSQLYREQGLLGLAGRGLGTRIIANGLQSVVFVVAWKLIPLYFQKRKHQQTHRQSHAPDDHEDYLEESAQ